MTIIDDQGTDARSLIPSEATMYAARCWPMLLIEPRGKRPLAAACPRGVRSATADLRVIADWCQRYPDANLAVACGAPGPQVLDVDDPRAVPATVAAAIRKAPRAATARGGHAYFAGTDAGTVALGYGELRGAGSYVLAPPSTHPSGKQYVWLHEPREPLPRVPAVVAKTAKPTWGAGDMPDAETVAPGGMYDHLGDLATRLARAGVVQVAVIERVLLAEFDAVRDPDADYGDPVQGLLDTHRIAEFAATSKIARRERAAGATVLTLRNAGLRDVG